jgi:hypothetical protein
LPLNKRKKGLGLGLGFRVRVYEVSALTYARGNIKDSHHVATEKKMVQGFGCRI